MELEAADSSSSDSVISLIRSVRQTAVSPFRKIRRRFCPGKQRCAGSPATGEHVHGQQKHAPPKLLFLLHERCREEEEMKAQAECLFNTYRDADDAIHSTGLNKLCTDMNVEPGDVRMLALAWRLRAPAMGEFGKDSFVAGCVELDVHTAEALRDQLDNVLYEAKRHFKAFYLYAYKLALTQSLSTAPAMLDAQTGRSPPLGTSDSGVSSGLDVNVAIELWRLVLPVCSGDAQRFIGDWIEFLRRCDISSISPVCWRVFPEFSQAVSADFANYRSDDSQWPEVIHHFVQDMLCSQSRVSCEH